MQDTSSDVVPGKEVPWLYFIFGPLSLWKTAISGTDFDFATENRFNMGMLQYKLPLIVIVAQ